MRTPKLLPLPVAIAELKAHIEHWRATRSHRGPMAKDLWSAAARLARDHGIYAIAQALRLNYEALKAWTEEPEEATRSVGLPVKPSGGGPSVVQGEPRADRPREQARKPSFVRLEPPMMSSAGSMIEVCSRDGTRMTIQLPGTVAVDVAALVAAFVRRR